MEVPLSSNQQTSNIDGLSIGYNDFRSWLLKYVEDVWGLPDGFDMDDGDICFEEIGMDSLEAHMMASLIEDDFNITFDPGILLEHSTLNKLASHITKR